MRRSAFVLRCLSPFVWPTGGNFHALRSQVLPSDNPRMTLNSAFAAFNFLAIPFLLLPSAWHWRARNTPTLLLIFWCLASVVPQAINSVVWYNTVDDVAPIWCDVSPCRHLFSGAVSAITDWHSPRSQQSCGSAPTSAYLRQPSVLCVNWNQSLPPAKFISLPRTVAVKLISTLRLVLAFPSSS